MQCPFCQTENREDRETCYVCGKDISTIRLLVNKARQHYNDALEHAERDRTTEAIDELKSALDLDASLVNAHVVLGTLYARVGKFTEARECWKNALELNPEMARAHDYLERVESVQAALPTLKTYRRVALLLLTVTVALAAYLITLQQPEPGSKALKAANEKFEKGDFREAEAQLEQAKTLSKPGGIVSLAAESLSHTLALDLQQRLRLIQDLKFRQLYPEALAAMAELEAIAPDDSTSAALATIREDIGYYYRNMLSQLYMAYEKGDLNYETLQAEVGRFIELYPPSPERDEVLTYIERAQNLEVQAAMEELHRRFALDNNVETALEGLRDIGPRFEGVETFQTARSSFVEDILSSLFNQFTGYLDQNDYIRALDLLHSIESVSTEFRRMVEVDVSGAVELAWSVLRDSMRQFHFQLIEDYLENDHIAAAEEVMWQELLEGDLTKAELGVMQSYWRQLNVRAPLMKLIQSPQSKSRYFELKISNQEASDTLQLYKDLEQRDLDRSERLQLTALAAASALKLGLHDEATSLSARLHKLDKSSSVTITVDKLVNDKIEKKTGEKKKQLDSKIIIEPARGRKQKEE